MSHLTTIYLRSIGNIHQSSLVFRSLCSNNIHSIGYIMELHQNLLRNIRNLICNFHSSLSLSLDIIHILFGRIINIGRCVNSKNHKDCCTDRFSCNICHSSPPHLHLDNYMYQTNYICNYGASCNQSHILIYYQCKDSNKCYWINMCIR